MKLNEILDTNLKIITAIIGFGILVASTTWIVSENVRVNPKIEKIAYLEQKITELRKIISDWNDAYDPYRKQIDDIFTDNRKFGEDLAAYKVSVKHTQDELEKSQTRNAKCQDDLEKWKNLNSDLQKTVNTYKQCPDALEGWKTHSAELQKKLDIYATNYNFISQINAYVQLKLSIDNNINSAMDGNFFSQSRRDNIPELQRQSKDVNDLILNLQQRLLCEPK
jgi:chromosome segregation ATPase